MQVSYEVLPGHTGVYLAPVENPLFRDILTHEAVHFVVNLARSFDSRRQHLLWARTRRQAALDAGATLDFLPETKKLRDGEWHVPSAPADLQDRRVEITGPSGDRKMVINALNSGAKVFMADFEDANSPTWENSLMGQVNLRDAIRRQISFVNPEGKHYELGGNPATLIVRPRGWHMLEKHLLVDGEPVPASLFDFGFYFFHNAKELLSRGSGPYFYLPKLESHQEARLWNDVFTFAEHYVGIPVGSIRATVLIETIPAAFEMDEILYELRPHASGLNCGRWDYIFSFIKKHRSHPGAVLPDRSLVTMTTEMMRNYSKLAIQTCHRRGAHAIGGMAAQIPIKNDPAANQQALEKVRVDKEREASDGHDGTWVAHPGLVPVALEVFNRLMPKPNQLDKKLDDFTVRNTDLLTPPKGPITEVGVRTNVRVGLEYIEAWLRGSGAVPINNLMEDAATAEISRAQLWQWIRYPSGVTDTGVDITLDYVRSVMDEELASLRQKLSDADQNRLFDEAAELLWDLTRQETFEDFLTTPGYQRFA
ncbi:malate synthase A [Alicyclobacillus ferrooxydans]|uniref:malate synthase A n=1 Tax=Alicyclobacillus ferrooxydans TaxID=471514 RepID=UPI0009F848DD|nr:malate synthase A [Alicyclobacillus ferrooxydans]